MSTEKAFQTYFMKTVPHVYRTSLVSGGGFPDCLIIHENKYSMVELKVLHLGKNGDKKLKSLFKPTQPPWYMNYLSKGGERLFIVFKADTVYGLIHVNKDFVREIDTIHYSDLWRFNYKEFKTLKGLIDEHFS